MVDLLAELVAAPTVLGHEESGQAVMRRTFGELGLDPVEVPLEPAALARPRGGAPFSWDVAPKATLIAPGAPGAPGRWLILNGHIDVVSPGPAVLWSSEPFAPRRDGDWVYG